MAIGAEAEGGATEAEGVVRRARAALVGIRGWDGVGEARSSALLICYYPGYYLAKREVRASAHAHATAYWLLLESHAATCRAECAARG